MGGSAAFSASRARARCGLLAALAAAGLGAGCDAEPRGRGGIETRVSVDRAEARVGDRIGVTLTIETPPGYAVELPSPPPAAAFETERVERLDPLEARGVVTHRLLWTLRAREVGEHALPELHVPLLRPDGSLQPLVAGGVPLPVQSVMAELPERKVFFDIRPAPPLARARVELWVGGALALAGLGVLAVWVLRRRSRPPSTPTTGELARRACDALDAVLAAADTDARRLATRIAAELWGFVGARWRVATAAATPVELPDAVEPELAALLAALEGARFERAPERDSVRHAGARARRALGALAAERADA